MLHWLGAAARVVFVVLVLAAIGIGGGIGLSLWYFSRDLPNYRQLTHYIPATGSKIYAGDGSFLAEFEKEHRIPVAIGDIPPVVVHAFLAAEDRDFYRHNGVNPVAMFRAAMTDIVRVERGQRPIGASTITQQVVRHFLLNNEVSIARKIKEAILAYRIERTLSKQRILEIYLNEIYLGAGAYGVAAAADTYFQKPLNKLTIAEAAFLAALPKAPNNYNPIRHPDAAKGRRDWVLSGMAEVGWITEAQARAAIAEPLGVHLREPQPNPNSEHSGYFVEEVRRELIARFGEQAVYEGGLRVRTSYVPAYQQMAETAFRNGLVAYDRRHGWRGPLEHLANGAAAKAALSRLSDPPGIASWQLAAVTGVDAHGAAIALRSGGVGHIPVSELRWARRTLKDQRLGTAVYRASEVLSPGDVVLVEPELTSAARHRRGTSIASYGLRQIPNVSGGVVAMDPKTGRVFALVGGWSFRQSQFDRATQAMRQPGSAIKPFVYVTALENGFSPQSMVEDAPVSIPQGHGLPAWQPANYEGGYVGPTTLEDALIHSRNLATVHVALTIGMPAIAKTVQNFDIMDRMPLYYSMALGAGETTLLRLTSAYSMLDNGGHWLLPSVIDLVQDRNGKILYQKGVNGCAACFVAAGEHGKPEGDALYRASGPADPSTIYPSYADHAVIYKPSRPDPLVTPDADYEIVSMMQGVVQRGTGVAVAAVGKPLAGKTGTTSDWFDAWFVGFSPDLAAGVFVGFDDPRTLGTGEQGGHVAAPIFRDFMAAALKDKPAKPFPVPPGAAPVIASAEDNSDIEVTRLDDNGAEVNADNDDAAGNERYGPAGGNASGNYPMPPQYHYPAPQWRGYPPARAGGYAAAGPPGYPPPWGQTYPPFSGYGYGYGYAPQPYATPSMPQYPGAPWTGRPGGGTGGLY